MVLKGEDDGKGSGVCFWLVLKVLVRVLLVDVDDDNNNDRL